MKPANHPGFSLFRVETRVPIQATAKSCSAIPSLEDAKRSRNKCIDQSIIRLGYNMVSDNVEKLEDAQYKQQRP